MAETKDKLPVVGHLHSNGDFCPEPAANDGSQGWPVDLVSKHAATSLIAELQRELAEARRDAERYRWLRHGDNDVSVMRYSMPGWEDHVWLPRGAVLDKAIDDAAAVPTGVAGEA